MNIVNRIKCRLGWHVWKTYHRKIRTPERIPFTRKRVVVYGCRRVCIHCKARETVEGELPMIEMPVINPGSTTTSASQSSLYELPEESKES